MNFLPRRRARLLGLGLALWGALAVGRLAQLQLVRGSKYRARAQRQQERRVEVSPMRGSILDRRGRELAVSLDVSSVYAIPDEVRDRLSTARSLAKLLPVARETLLSRLKQPKGFVWLARKIDPVTATRVRGKGLPGINLLPEAKRFYPKGKLGAAVLGFVGTDDRGLGGLEYSYDKTLRGRPGEFVALTDARRASYGASEPSGRRLPREGASLVLSLDSGIQFAAERELQVAVEQAHAQSGILVLLDPYTGEVLAMASFPGFDPNQFARYPPSSRRNRAIADAHEPGSTFKIVTAALALENSVVSLEERIETGDGSIRIGNTTICEREGNRFGALSLAEIFEHSSNVGIIRIGLRLGAWRLFQGASTLGVGCVTGVDLPGENPGIFRDPPRWSALSSAMISMGQEVSVTPLQLVRIAAAIANGGFLIQPRLVTHRIYPDGHVEPVPALPPERAFSERTARALTDLLLGVVERGTGTKASIPGFAVAGKTGTAQKAGIGGYQPGQYIASFVGFAPVGSPRLAGIVVIEEPRGKYYGSEVAAPLFGRVVSQALAILRVAPAEQRLPHSLLASSPSFSIRYPPGVIPASVPQGSGEVEKPPAFRLDQTPSVIGLSARKALALFARHGVSARLQGTGFVVRQSPPAGALLRPAETHMLYLAQRAAAPEERRRAEETQASPSAP